ncbi:MAG: hypothetical protein HW421_669 [Ignavibacteria bacterium]|nr:hypothetical protein [Ignavibacteria bacterium]
MKKLINFLMIISAVLFILFVITGNSSAQPNEQSANQEFIQEENEVEAREERAEYEQMRLADPTVGIIPANIRIRELQFANKIQSQSNYMFKKEGSTTKSVDWVSRGPANIGARTRALGIDVANENIILAGGTTGGMWRSSDRGVSWLRTTPLSILPSTSCLVQDKRQGKTNTWYYGTGEFGYEPTSGGNTGGYPLGKSEAAHKWGEYFGNGIFKSIDNGLTWTVLASTKTDTVGSLIQPFNFVFRIATDKSNILQDVVYAAVPGGIERSSDGGSTWKMVLGNFPEGSAPTDVAVTSKGIVYAVICSNLSWKGLRGDSIPSQSTEGGIYRSVDGMNWVNISPPEWRRTFFLSLIAIAPSNENVVYFALDYLQNSVITGTLWKYSYGSGDGSGSSGTFEERSANPMMTWVLSVKPDDENTVFMGGVLSFRSTDGFATSNNTNSLSTPHVDHFALAYFPSNPASMILGCDGGLFQTDNNLYPSPVWKSLNNNYLTAQFYTVAIDHSSPGDLTIIGGIQDNNSNFSNSPDPNKPWTTLHQFDGATCAIAGGRTSYYVSWQYGHAYRKVLNEKGGILKETRIDPIGSTQYVWINPFALDPNNNSRMYFGGGSFLWRNDDVTLIPFGGTGATNVGWTKLERTKILPIDSVVRIPMITAITCAKTPVNCVYYGTNDGRLFRIDSANSDYTVPKPIWEGKGFPKLGYVSSIAIDSKNADIAIVAFSNYSVQSLFYTSDAGNSWTAIGGNLEEYPDGKGSGPSIRTAAIMHSGNGIVYLAGTSTGLYSTTSLNGMATVWTLEGENTIGNNIINMIDTRESDGMVAVATCGHGVFSGGFEAASAVTEDTPLALNINNYPNPASGLTTIDFSISEPAIVSLTITNTLGIELDKIINNQLQSTGNHTINYDSNYLSAGTYFLILKAGNNTETKKFVFIR